MTVSLYGDLLQFSDSVYRFCQHCHHVEIPITTLIFGELSASSEDSQRVLRNPDLTHLTLPMPHVRQVLLDTETHDFHQVERFLTYALNYLDRDMVKEKLQVYIHGDPERLHVNLLNTLRNTCDNITFVEENEEMIR